MIDIFVLSFVNTNVFFFFFFFSVFLSGRSTAFVQQNPVLPQTALAPDASTANITIGISLWWRLSNIPIHSVIIPEVSTADAGDKDVMQPSNFVVMMNAMYP